ncbi:MULTISPECIES: YidC/Oxa1 family membrane protein insertase [unclassified Clostridium]|uniref:YidC/Oxa1 family membrane protein insertase n=1 Tax=unclassified Clostridium TaxID=2614128 RepID=UPI000E4E9784|nr:MULTISPECIES: YidC/Oxa1 family membrane protein insertase [unclassified Clostridium]RHP42625.1 membrane protein insertase YidC [Clostridium sp. AF32-12BH]RHV64370.1 membrane protein insertase YidC [Clostridium sp. OM02-18AC]
MDYLVLTKVHGAILGPISQILGWILNILVEFTNSFGILNIGLSIILFTLVVKILMFPLTIKQQKASKLMAVMQPELQAIQAKYKGKTDNDSMMKMNVETKAVYEKYGTSMTGGCLQLVIQMPILFALYRVIYCIPAYVMPIKEHFLNVVYALTGSSSASALTEGAAANLLQFATDHNIALTGVNPIGDLTGVSGEALANKMVDILYKLNPAQWGELAQAFPNAASVISDNAATIEKMNTFLGINLSSNPFNGSFVPNLAWLIPILAGLTQYASTKLMMATQPKKTNNGEDMSSQMMQSMNVTMPLMSVFFCFTFPAAIGIYWVASSTFQLLQQLIVNTYLSKVDMDELIRKNVEKANKKRAKKGLPPQKVNQNATANLKHMEAVAAKEEAERAEKLEKSKKQVEQSTSYYNKDAKPGSLASKANMVARYNEKHNNK